MGSARSNAVETSIPAVWKTYLRFLFFIIYDNWRRWNMDRVD
ncbi:hypothetical protein SCH4B_4837 [Ruegeria sp. TrichCH4B]|nr:hypothetical protein SCH4B_4837 [Ruegeria sp. TrichCH4B]